MIQRFCPILSNKIVTTYTYWLLKKMCSNRETYMNVIAISCNYIMQHFLVLLENFNCIVAFEIYNLLYLSLKQI